MYLPLRSYLCYWKNKGTLTKWQKSGGGSAKLQLKQPNLGRTNPRSFAVHALLLTGTLLFKVGTSGYGNLQTMNADRWATSKSTQLSTKIWVKLLLLLDNALKLNFWGPLTNWKVEPSPRPPSHSDPTINKHTEQVKKLCIDLSWHALNSLV